MNLNEARILAEEWIVKLRPACERVEIAGSIRRAESEVGDIDIVCIPSITTERNLFDDPTGQSINHLENLLQTYKDDEDFTFYNPYDPTERTANGPRQKKLFLPQRIKLELWIVIPPAQWGAIFILRTGPAQFGHWLVTSKQQGGGLPSHLKVKDGALQNGFKIIETPEERDFFNAIDLPYIQPQDRIAKWSQP